MFRRETARTLLALLAAALLALQFFAPTESFAAAHTVRQVEAKAQPGITPSGKALRDQLATHRHCDGSRGPTGPLRTRDRQRSADSAPEGPERGLPIADPAAARKPAAPRAPRVPRPSTAHSPAALQVFRC
ncbi:hypothetical protein ABZT17_25435 [Streptomyces sp. NPDC005648]|uniref:hypothetical protein n=1 Tax=Streptomyces sp. NPDC005648 TaxID=3157044 RepID=UPI0033A591C0